MASLARPQSFAAAAGSSPAIATPLNLLCIAWIDDTQLTRECFAHAAAAMQPLLAIVPFHSVSAFLADPPAAADLVVYHQHGDDTAALEAMTDGQSPALPMSPIVILADIVTETVTRAVRRFPRGMATLLPTRETSLHMVVASLFLIFHGRDIAHQPLTPAATPFAPPRHDASHADTLTARERAVLELVRQGFANKDIATHLVMSISTVKAHVRNIMQKTHATNRTQLALSAERQLHRPRLHGGE